MTLTVATAGQLLVHGPLDTTGEPAGPVRQALSDAAAFSNFEACVATPGAWPTKAKTLHLAAPEALPSVAALGFAGIGHANNHAFDLGPPGLARTREQAEAAGLAFCGSGPNRDAALRPAWLPGRVAVIAADCGPQQDIAYAGADRPGIARLATRRIVAVPPDLHAALAGLERALGDARRAAARAAVGYGEATEAGGFALFGTRIVAGDTVRDGREPDAGDLAALAAAIVSARRDGAALVVACLHAHHWDPDWTVTPAWLLAVAAALVDAGADMVIGHGAPVLQGLAFHAGKPILAGLGNLVFHTRRGDTYRREGVDVFRSAVVRARFAADGSFAGLAVLPVQVPGEAPEGPSQPPTPLAGADAEAMMDRLTRGLTVAQRALVTRIG